MYTKPDSVTKVAENLAFPEAKEIMNKSYFNNKPSKDGNDTGRCSVNLRILFNGAEEDQNELRNQLQEKFITYDNNAQVWFAKLQLTEKPKLLGRLLYPVPILGISTLLENILQVIKEGKISR